MPQQHSHPLVNRFHRNFAYLILMTVFLWQWTRHPFLSQHNPLLFCLLLVPYLVLHLFAKPNRHNDYTPDVIILYSCLLVFLSLTGSLGSPFFFLTYFLLFSVALLLDIATTVTFTCLIVLFFLDRTRTLSDFTQIVSLLFFTPLAIVFRRQFSQLQRHQHRVEQLLRREKNLQHRLTEEEHGSLTWLTLDFKDAVSKIIHYSAEMLGEVDHVNPKQRHRLHIINDSAKELLRSGNRLLKELDEGNVNNQKAP